MAESAVAGGERTYATATAGAVTYVQYERSRGLKGSRRQQTRERRAARR